MGAAITAGGGLLGGIGGAMAGRREGGQDAGNVYATVLEKMGGASGLGNILNQSMQQQQVYSGDPTKELQQNAILGQLYGPQGTMGRTTAEEQRLAEQGFDLTPEDRTAYGQVYGDIARQFGEQEQSLA